MTRVQVQSKLGDRPLEVEKDAADFWLERGYRLVQDAGKDEAPKRRTRRKASDEGDTQD